ncbi:flagellin, partial [bacterium]|nr:flagellin [bacterium]
MTIKVRSENLILINNLNRTSDRLATAMGRLSTGYRINSASDGAAELMLSKGLEKQISGLSVCNDNANMAKSLLTVADGSLSEITSMAQRIRDIALSSANGIYSEDERRAYQSEVDALVEEIKRQTDEARYNDYKLFYGNTSPAIKTNVSAGTTGAVGTYKVQKVSKAEAEAQGYTCVTTAQELKDALVAGDSSCKVMLMADINLGDLGLDATGSNWTAVGNDTTQFKGTLDGNGYTIRNLKINATSGYQGLFGYTATSSSIKNLNIKNADIKNTGNRTAGLVGENHGTITDCSVDGIIKSSGEHSIGGLVAYNYGNISNCGSNVNIESTNECLQIGGLVGINYAGDIINCYAKGEVKSNGGHVGGLIGYNNKGNVLNSYATGNVTGGENVGGFVGFANSNSNIEYCYATGDVRGVGTAAGKIGGFVGWKRGSINACYATGEVTGKSYVGGFVGLNDIGAIKSSYSSGNVTGTGHSVGGFVGRHRTSIEDSYSTGNATGGTDQTGGFIGVSEGAATLSNYSFVGSGAGVGVGATNATGADDTAGKDANWFESRNNLAGILGDSFDYSYLNSNLTFQVGVNAGSLNTLDINLSFGVDNLRIDVMSGDSSRESISAIDELIEYTTQVQGRI